MRRMPVVLFLSMNILLNTAALAQAQLQWRALPNAPRTTDRFDDVFFINPNIGWIVHAGGELFRTTDGGATWQLQSTIPTGGLRSLGFANAAKGWLGTLQLNDFFFSTNDSGKTWIEVQNIPDPKPEGICGISVVNENIVYASGVFSGAPRVIKTVNGGQTWQTFDLSAQARALVDCYFYSADSGFVVGGVGSTSQDQRALILHTSNGGVNWTTRFTGTRPRELCWKISFPSRKVGCVSIEALNQGAVYFLKTTDGGQTWQDKILSNTYRDVQGIGFVDEMLGWQGGYGSVAYETTDGGDSWRPAGFGFNINRFRFLSNTLGYAVGQTVYKLSTSTAVSEQDKTREAPENFSLAQNYPNPFNPSTKIHFSLSRNSAILLAVYNLQGTKIKTLAAGLFVARNHEVRWDGADDFGEEAAAGVYIYRLQNGSVIQAKKMLLLR